MRKNGRLFIILGVGLACLAAALAFLMFRGVGSSQAVERAPTPVKVVVAARDVPPHQVLRLEDLNEEVRDPDLVPQDQSRDKSAVLGLAPKRGLVKGQPVMRAELEVTGLANDIEKGRRAVTIPVDRSHTMAGMLRESDYIDLIFSLKVDLIYILPSLPVELDSTTAGDREFKSVLPNTPPTEPSAYAYPGEPGSRYKMRTAGQKGDPVAKVVMQDIKVLRVMAGPATQPQGQNGQQQGNAQNEQNAALTGDLLVLELTDEQAELMKFILDNQATDKVAPFSFTVRAKDDHDKVNTKGITYDLLVTEYQLPAPKSVRQPGERQP